VEWEGRIIADVGSFETEKLKYPRCGSSNLLGLSSLMAMVASSADQRIHDCVPNMERHSPRAGKGCQ